MKSKEIICGQPKAILYLTMLRQLFLEESDKFFSETPEGDWIEIGSIQANELVRNPKFKMQATYLEQNYRWSLEFSINRGDE